MVGLNKAIAKSRTAIESLYNSKATVYEYKPVKNPATKITTHEEVAVFENQACHLSFTSIPVASQTESAAALKQVVKLFIAPELKIKPGSKITVTQNGVTEDYGCSGKPAVYQTHQEIMLELWEGWA